MESADRPQIPTSLHHQQGQFRALQAAFRLVGDKGIHIRSVTQGERHVVIDWRISYIFRLAPTFLDPWCALTLPCTTTLELNGAGRVVKHTDHWSVHELLGGIPVLGLLYRAAKRVTGKASSVLTNGLWDVLAGPNKQPSSPSSTIMGSLGSAAPPSEASLAPADGSARGASSGTITSVASSGGARSSIRSGGVSETVSEEDKVLQPWPSR